MISLSELILNVAQPKSNSFFHGKILNYSYTTYCNTIISKIKTTYLSLCVPLKFGAVDEKIDLWVKIIKADLLCITTVVPENNRIGSIFGVTILIKLNMLV